MAWNRRERANFFNSNGGNDEADLAEDFMHPEDSDKAFLERYCSEITREELSKGGVSAAVARCLVGRLAELVPDGDHTSPKWSGGTRPVIVIARSTLRVGKTKCSVVSHKPKFGLCAQDGHLYVWANRDDIDKSRAFDADIEVGGVWVPWPEGGGSLRYTVSVDCVWGTELEHFHPLSAGQPLLRFLQYIAQRIAAVRETESHLNLADVLGPCRNNLDEPEGFAVIYPRLAEELGGSLHNDEPGTSDARSDAKPEIRSTARRRKSPRSPVARGAQDGNDENLTFESHAGSMLQVVREIAIARVRTMIPEFSGADLDNSWIVTGGYPGANAPHIDTGDLFLVYAASLANAGGRKPNPSNFGELVRHSMGAFIQQKTVNRVPTAQVLALNCQDVLARYPIGGSFADDLRKLAEHGKSRPLMSGLMTSVTEFAQWLCLRCNGTADGFHQLTRDLGDNPERSVFELIRELDKLPWMGIATAANFVKDSQVASLQIDGLDPRASAGRLAGWFAKPDLHVARLMAYITGRVADGSGLRQLKLAQALGHFYKPPADNFESVLAARLPKDGPEIRVIADIHEWARAVGTSALEIDRILYLIGVKRTEVNGIVISHPWYPTFVRQVDAAIARGVRRKS